MATRDGWTDERIRAHLDEMDRKAEADASVERVRLAIYDAVAVAIAEDIDRSEFVALLDEWWDRAVRSAQNEQVDPLF